MHHENSAFELADVGLLVVHDENASGGTEAHAHTAEAVSAAGGDTAEAD
jgi:hypothetical protein